jgi:hypothetical protein
VSEGGIWVPQFRLRLTITAYPRGGHRISLSAVAASACALFQRALLRAATSRAPWLSNTCAVGWEPNGLGSLAVHTDSVIAHASSPAVEHAPTSHGSVSGGDDFSSWQSAPSDSCLGKQAAALAEVYKGLDALQIYLLRLKTVRRMTLGHAEKPSSQLQ